MSGTRERLARIFRCAAPGARKAGLAVLAVEYPFLARLLRAQEAIPIPERVLENHLRERLAGTEGLENVSLTCEDGHFRLLLETSKWFAQHRFPMDVTLEASEISRRSREIVFRFPGEIEAEGRNFLGTLSAFLTEPMLLSLLEAPDTATAVQARTKGLVTMDWPLVSVHPEKHPVAGKVLAWKAKVMGWEFDVLDFISLGPCTIEKGRVLVRVQAGQPAEPEQRATAAGPR
jgi:hypothetical protein